MDNSIKSTNIPASDNNQVENAKKEFKFIIMIILFILFIFLCMFVYNLIKCYLPKWRRTKRDFVDMTENTNENNNRKIEMFDA